jgi:type II secretory pathway component GspD/PulD (secretin)
MTNKFHSLFITLVLLLPQTALAGNMQLEVIPLQNRMVDDVIHIIRPLVTPGGTVTGMNNQLIIKTTPSNLSEIKQVLNSIDHAPRRLMITVKQNVGGNSYLREDSLTGKYASDNVQISAGHDHSYEGLSVSAGDKNSQLRYRTLNSTSRADDKNIFKVQALEGRPAFINQGQSIPVDSSTTYVTERGVVVNKSTNYHEVGSGFYVLPRLNGDQVTLIAATDLSSIQPGSHPTTNVQGVETTVTGRLGEWMELGGIDQSFNQGTRQNFSSSSARGQESHTVLIRVDEIK